MGQSFERVGFCFVPCFAGGILVGDFKTCRIIMYSSGTMQGPEAAGKQNTVKILRGVRGDFGKDAFCKTSFYRPNYCHSAAIPTSNILSPNCGRPCIWGPCADWLATLADQKFSSILSFARTTSARSPRKTGAQVHATGIAEGFSTTAGKHCELQVRAHPCIA